ncbi:MAG: hypothetical protein ABFS46_13635 [Myxococcota bacterium]
MDKAIRRLGILVVGAAVLGLVAPVEAQGPLTACRMTYDLKGWSVLYKTARGPGRIVCENGQTASVQITTHGGGITFGVDSVVGGRGVISGVWDIDEIFGVYVQAVGHAGAGPSVSGRVMTKGRVSLALSEGGRGVNLGFAFGAFSIRRS